jgi:hypothetical protein
MNIIFITTLLETANKAQKLITININGVIFKDLIFDDVGELRTNSLKFSTIEESMTIKADRIKAICFNSDICYIELKEV